MSRPRKVITATRELEVNIGGIKYDALLIPQDPSVEVDYTRFPEDDPAKRAKNIGKMSRVHLEFGVDVYDIDGQGKQYKLTPEGAKRLLETL